MSEVYCPLPGCFWSGTVTDPDPASLRPDALAGVFGVGVFAARARHGHLQALEDLVSAHVGTHSVVDWVGAVTRLTRTNRVLTERAQGFEESYRLVADAVIDEFNPPDGDDAEEAVVTGALTRAREFVESTPCMCTESVADPEVFDEPCPRCVVLGRRKDRREER